MDSVDDLDSYLLLPDEVHQAAGMISVQMNVPVRTALELLCRLAREHCEDVAWIAAQVTTRSVRFDRAGVMSWA